MLQIFLMLPFLNVQKSFFGTVKKDHRTSFTLLLIFFIFSFFCFLIVPVLSSITVTPYSFALSPNSHQLDTMWEVSGSGSVSLLCGLATISMMEISWTGDSKELSSGNSWAVTCEEVLGQNNKMMIQVDVTKFRVKPFRSYKVCISLDEDYNTELGMDPVCTHLFSFEKSIPYIPDDKREKSDTVDKVNETTQAVTEKIDSEFEEKDKSGDSEYDIFSTSEDEEFRKQLDDIKNFVRDGFNQELSVQKEPLISDKESNYVVSNSNEIYHHKKLYIILLTFFITSKIHCQL